jgi:dihydrofolate reductase
MALSDLQRAGIEIALIAALDQHYAIGQNGALPWHIPEDLARFKRLTLHHSIVMGRKTFDSIGKALPKRRNIVISRDPSFHAPNTERLASLDEISLSHIAAHTQTLWIIGGGQLYQQCIDHADRLELTWVSAAAGAPEVFFPAFERDQYTASDETPAGFHAARFVSYRRLK